MTTQIAVRTISALLLLAFLGLVALVVTSPHHFVYDEPYYANYVPLLHRYGFTETFLDSLAGSAGPLSAFVNIAFEPATHLQPVRMRFVNVLLLTVVVGILAACQRRQEKPNGWLTSCSVLIIPMTWVVAGLALTEMSALVFVTLSLFLQLRGLVALDERQPVVGWFVASGVCLGIAVWGRQPYLLLAGVPVLLLILERRLLLPTLIFVGIVLAMAIPLFVAWKGLVPPITRLNLARPQEGISVTHGLVALGYTGFCFLLLAPQFRSLPWKAVIAMVSLTAAANAWLGALVFYPVHSAIRYIPKWAAPLYGNLCGTLILSCGVVFLAMMVRTIWEDRKDLRRVAVSTGLLCVAGSPVFIATMYSSRYTAMTMPYMILATQRWREWRLVTVLAALFGCGAGFLSLMGYYLGR